MRLLLLLLLRLLLLLLGGELAVDARDRLGRACRCFFRRGGAERLAEEGDEVGPGRGLEQELREEDELLAAVAASGCGWGAAVVKHAGGLYEALEEEDARLLPV